MYQEVLNFIKYNNAFTIIFVVVFFGFGISFAANPEMRDIVYSSEETVVSIDNTLVVSADLDNFNFNLRINSVTEDDKNYYAVYSYQTLEIKNDFWQNKEIEKTLTVNKEALGGKDLGLYMAEELGENIRYELSYLKRVQKLEKEKGESLKVVTTAYSGLIGKLLNPKEEVIEGYNPVIPEIVPEVSVASVVVSTPYSQPLPEVTASAAEPQENPAPEPVLPQTEPTQESASISTSTPPQTEFVPEPISLPAPEEMVDEGLIQEVVGEFLQGQATSTSVSEPATSTPEIISEPVIEAVPEATAGEAEPMQ